MGHETAGGRAAKQLFELIVASVKDYAIFLLDPSGHVATWNSGAELIKGYRPDEVIGKEMSIFYTPEDLERGRPQTLLKRALAEGRVEDEGWRVRKDGSRFWADVVITVIQDPEGAINGFVKVTRDLTLRREAEERLRRSEDDLQATLYSIGDGVLAVDDQSRVTRINPVAEQLTGWSEREAIGRALEDVFHIVNEETRAKVRHPVTRVLAEGIVVGLANHTALIARDGTERPIADSGAPIRDARGAIRGAVLVFRDVTNERRTEEALRQSEERLRQMIASVHDYAIFMLDKEGCVTSWNPGAQHITGYQEHEVLGRPFKRFFTPEDISDGKPGKELETAARAGRFEEEAWRARKDGTRFWASVVVTPIRDSSGGLVGFVKISRDLTERRKAEEERLRLARAGEAIRLRHEFLSITSHELNTPLAALQLQLLRTRDRPAPDATLAEAHERERGKSDQLAAANQDLESFSYSVSHDLRAPLRAVDGFSQELEEQYGATLDAEARRLLGIIRARAQFMGQLIEDLLAFSRLGRQALHTKCIELDHCVRGYLEELQPEIKERSIQFAVHPLGTVQADPALLKQVWMNLLGNAIKFTRRRPDAAIEIGTVRTERGEAYYVKDNGAGFDMRHVDKLFGVFQRLHTVKEYEGTGVGLAIVQRIVTRHGGRIWAEATPGEGATFYFTLGNEEGLRLKDAR